MSYLLVCIYPLATFSKILRTMDEIKYNKVGEVAGVPSEYDPIRVIVYPTEKSFSAQAK
jgi:hypothetical protein